jgi:toxin-antitoxin system PIN domain toxin
MPAKPAARRKAAGAGQAGRAPVHLLDGNLLYALIDEAHVHHAPARRWFASASCGFATCPITQGTLLRLAMRLGGNGIAQALSLLEAVTAHPRHHFWPDAMPYAQVQWQGVMGHRQVTDAYLAGLARHHRGKLARFDRGLVALHADVGVAVA